MKTRIQILCLVVVAVALGSAASADDFGTGGNTFTIDFVTISGDASSANGTNIGSGKTFSDPGNDYRMGVYEISNGQWDKFKAELGVPVTGSPPDAYDNDPHFWGGYMPATAVSWYEAAQFVNWLNTSTGHHAAYRFTGDQGTSGYALDVWSTADADGGANLYRHKEAYYFLPSEDEWVKAAYWNGKTIQTYSNASDDDLVSGYPDPMKWFYSRTVAFPEPQSVTTGAQELNGTHNMMGNTKEFLESPYSDMSYGTGSNRVIRGGGFGNSEGGLSSSSRDWINPRSEPVNAGFRVASDVPTPLRSVSAVDIAAGFVPGVGAHGLGELTAVGQADVVVEDSDDQQTTYAGGSFEMTASLGTDNSAGGLAAGQFSGGVLAFRDAGGADLLTGDLIELLLYEVGDDMGMLAGSGLFEVTGGSLQGDFLETHGEIFQMFFQVTPRNIDNFAAAFTGFTDITVTPVPEPATLGMLALGGSAALRRRRQQYLGAKAKSSTKEA